MRSFQTVDDKLARQFAFKLINQPQQFLPGW
jgi:hypothetical protein